MALEHRQGGLQASSCHLGGGLAPLLRLGALQEGQAAVVGGVLPAPCPHRLHWPQPSGLWLCGKKSTTEAPAREERWGKGYVKGNLFSQLP